MPRFPVGGAVGRQAARGRSLCVLLSQELQPLACSVLRAGRWCGVLCLCLVVVERVGIFHFALHYKEDFLGVVFPHVVLARFGHDIVGDGLQVYIDVAVGIRLGIEDTAADIVLIDEVEEVIQVVVRELFFQFLRQVVLDETRCPVP